MAAATVPHAFWTPDDEDQLVNFLLDHRASAGDGGNFKEATFQALSPILAPLVMRGGPKTVHACQNKWNAVRFFFPIVLGHFLNIFFIFLKLCQTFRVIQAIKNVSGWTWSDETGASITPELKDS